MKVVRGQPISGGAGQFRTTPNVLSDASRTSRDAQQFVKASPSPMQNKQGPMNISAPVHRYFDSNNRKSVYFDKGTALNPLKKAGGFSATNFSIRKGTTHSASEMAAVGYGPRATMSRNNSLITGYPTRGAVRTVGGGNQPSAKQRAKYPGIFGSTKYRP